MTQLIAQIVVFVRHLIGTHEYNGYDTNFVPLYKLDTEAEVDAEALLDAFCATITKAVEGLNFTPIKEGIGIANGLRIESRRVCCFRGEELELPFQDTEDATGKSWPLNLTVQCLEKLDQSMVLLAAYRLGHSCGSPYDYRVLAVPRGSLLHPRSISYHESPFDQEVNWMSGMDSNSETTVRLPEGSLVWNGKEWTPISRLRYHY